MRQIDNIIAEVRGEQTPTPKKTSKRARR
jgi:hypothetical protein